MIAYAQSAEVLARSALDRLNDAILFPLITLLTSVAIVIFLWGAFEFISKAESDEAHTNGKRHMLWGIIGLFVMLTAYTILRLAANTVGAPVPS
ncbi:hypothetical protein KTR10_02065 [Candidatus Kaiserbacteria bacterium]|nr:hypothetical protein [Candidatus Kaiserbacteria bacterium]